MLDDLIVATISEGTIGREDSITTARTRQIGHLGWLTSHPRSKSTRPVICTPSSTLWTIRGNPRIFYENVDSSSTCRSIMIYCKATPSTVIKRYHLHRYTPFRKDSRSYHHHLQCTYLKPKRSNSSRFIRTHPKLFLTLGEVSARCIWFKFDKVGRLKIRRPRSSAHRCICSRRKANKHRKYRLPKKLRQV